MNVATTVFEQTNRIPHIILAAIQPARRGTMACERSVSGLCRAAVRLRAHQVRPRLETNLRNVRCCLELRRLCLHAACQDRTIAESSVTIRWRARADCTPPSACFELSQVSVSRQAQIDWLCGCWRRAAIQGETQVFHGESSITDSSKAIVLLGTPRSVGHKRRPQCRSRASTHG